MDKYTIVGRGAAKSIYNWLQYFSVESLSAEFRRAGLEVTEVYSDVAGGPYDPAADEFAVIAEKARE